MKKTRARREEDTTRESSSASVRSSRGGLPAFWWWCSSWCRSRSSRRCARRTLCLQIKEDDDDDERVEFDVDADDYSNAFATLMNAAEDDDDEEHGVVRVAAGRFYRGNTETSATEGAPGTGVDGVLDVSAVPIVYEEAETVMGGKR